MGMGLRTRAEEVNADHCPRFCWNILVILFVQVRMLYCLDCRGTTTSRGLYHDLLEGEARNGSIAREVYKMVCISSATTVD